MVTYLTSPYQVEFFNEITAGGEISLRVIYLRRQHDQHPWGRVTLKHEHLVLEGHPEVVRQAFGWVLEADLTVCNYYTHWFALAALHLRHLSARPWAFWGERPGFLRLGCYGRLARRLLLYPISKSAAPIWAIGQAGVAGYMNDWGADKSYVNLPYFSDLSRFRKQPRTVRAEERVVLYSGILNSRKGVLGLAEGFRAAARAHPNLRLIILGSGPLERQMREILQPVAAQVSWEGFREWQELPAFYAQADALCLPTRHDGWAMVVPEALAAGLPVITTEDAGAARELVTHEVNGWLLPNSEAKAIESALRLLAELAPADLARTSAAARASVNDHTLDEGRSRFVAAAHEAMAAFHCRRTGLGDKKRHLLITGTYAPDRLHSMQRYTDLVQSVVTPVFGDEVERLDPHVVLGGLSWMPRRVRKQFGYVDKYLIFPLRLRWQAAFQAGRGVETLIHVTDQGLGPLIPWLRGFGVIVTVHDLIAVRAAIGDIPSIPRAGWWRGAFQRYIFWALRFPSTIVCVSNKTREDCERLVGQEHRFHVVLNPLDPAFEVQAETVCAPELPLSFLLHVGNGLWYKNREGVLSIYAALRRRLGLESAPALVMMGAAATEAENELVVTLGIGSCVTWFARPPTSMIVAAYDQAQALIFPSFEEGFGWPVLEAMARGCPVFTSNRAPLTEVGGDAVEYIDPENVEQAAEVITECLRQGAAWREQKSAQGRLRARELSVSRFGEEMVEVYTRVLNSPDQEQGH
ncbi:glycosyltransferase [Prosthecobacter sp.]|uniref:glycosyltransferase n=1 Tax=Prosthecobacter sp. TaxID=1965333 RepID=UPI0024881840|nr:glycosyltransferase [Prosthecobacter sp.]MDI1315127.1 glycosyltransferase [Prosthecobacter sp.]